VAQSSDLPAHVRVIIDAANTLDVDDHTDAWETPAQLMQWLHQHTGTSSSGRITADEHAAAVAFRDALRQLITDGVAADFDAAAAPFPLRVAAQDGVPELVPTDDGPLRGVATVAAAIARSTAEGTWDRVKICPADDCLYAFYDESRNHSRTWCSMRVCGNRTKTKVYRARHQPA
jgi:predicted RNA-binding Zn ribbon-like protein